MIAQSVKNGGNPPQDEEKARFRKRAAIGVVRKYKKGKVSLTWLQGMIAYLRNKKGLTENEIKQVLTIHGCRRLEAPVLRAPFFICNHANLQRILMPKRRRKKTAKSVRRRRPRKTLWEKILGI